MTRGNAPGGLATVTHARLRAAQGDVAGARLILESILALCPGDDEARHLLEALPSVRAREAPGEIEEPLAPAPEGNREATLRRLRDLLGRVRSRDGPSSAR